MQTQDKAVPSTRWSKPVRRRRGESGQAMIEGALIFVPMFALFFGILDIGFAVSLQNAFVHAAREGTRVAITYPSKYDGVDCSSSQYTCISHAVQINSLGFLSGSNASKIVVNYYTANDLTNPMMVCNSSSGCVQKGTLPLTLANGTVVTSSNQPGNVVEVVVSNYFWSWMAPISGLGGNGLNLGASAVDVLGGLAVGTTTPPTP